MTPRRRLHRAQQVFSRHHDRLPSTRSWHKRPLQSRPSTSTPPFLPSYIYTININKASKAPKLAQWHTTACPGILSIDHRPRECASRPKEPREKALELRCMASEEMFAKHCDSCHQQDGRRGASPVSLAQGWMALATAPPNAIILVLRPSNDRLAVEHATYTRSAIFRSEVAKQASSCIREYEGWYITPRSTFQGGSDDSSSTTLDQQRFFD